MGIHTITARILRILAAALLLSCAPAKAANGDSGITTTLASIISADFLENYKDYVPVHTDAGNTRLVLYTVPAIPAPVGKHYGPFRLVSEQVAEMSGAVNSATPRQFRAMLRSHPGIRTLNLVDVPGTVDDDANLALARMVRAREIDTYVPANGSVRSGGVELFAAGKTRIAEPGAEFVVHSWRDGKGYEANDFPMSDPVHQGYIHYYEDMGLNADDARAFYALTNSVPNAGQRVVTLEELRKYKLIN